MTTTDIRGTVLEALSNAGLGQYEGRANPVIDRLEQRETTIAQRLIEFAESRGLSQAEATYALRTAGMAVDEPPASNGDSGRRIADLEERIDQMRQVLDEASAALGDIRDSNG